VNVWAVMSPLVMVPKTHVFGTVVVEVVTDTVCVQAIEFVIGVVELTRKSILLAKGFDLDRRRIVRRILEDFSLGHENVAGQKSHVTSRQSRVLGRLTLQVTLHLAHVREHQATLKLSLERRLGNLEFRILGCHRRILGMGVNLRRKLTQQSSVFAGLVVDQVTYYARRPLCLIH
jgi:hypothetical protein